MWLASMFFFVQTGGVDTGTTTSEFANSWLLKSKKIAASTDFLIVYFILFGLTWLTSFIILRKIADMLTAWIGDKSGKSYFVQWNKEWEGLFVLICANAECLKLLFKLCSDD